MSNELTPTTEQEREEWKSTENPAWTGQMIRRLCADVDRKDEQIAKLTGEREEAKKSARNWEQNCHTAADQRMAEEGKRIDAERQLTAARAEVERVKAETVEACAKVAEGERREASEDEYDGGYNNAVKDCAAAIRALTPAQPQVHDGPTYEQDTMSFVQSELVKPAQPQVQVREPDGVWSIGHTGRVEAKFGVVRATQSPNGVWLFAVLTDYMDTKSAKTTASDLTAAAAWAQRQQQKDGDSCTS